MRLLVSVVIPVFNTERFISEALESVVAQGLGPTELQIIVVDDGSTDGSMAAVETVPWPVEIVRQANLGIGAARNRGVEAASGEFLAFLDADDLWAPSKLALQLAVLKGESPPDMVTGMVEQFREDVPGERTVVEEVRPGYVAGAMLIPRESFLRVGPFPTHLRAGEFVDWFARATDMGLSCRVLGDTVLQRRIHDANTARTSAGNTQDLVAAVRGALLRRRGQA